MITLQHAVQDFLEAKRAQRLSETTLIDYASILKRFVASIGEDKLFSKISRKDISAYLASLNVSKKRVKNIYITLSSLWTWGVATGGCQEHVLRTISPPKPEKRAILPLLEDEIRAMLNAIENGESLSYSRPGKRPCRHSLPVITVRRDKAILLFLLDTGARASEVCNLRIHDIGILGARVLGKGAKERVVPLSEATRQAIDEYLAVRKAKPSDMLFTTVQGRPITRYTLASIIGRIARRAEVPGAHPHKFRHTFAVNFLRNGGDIFSLQAILGHETLEMVKQYVAIAKMDIQRAHAKASPVKNWGL